MPLNVNNGSIKSFESLLLKYKNVDSHPQLSDKITDYLASIDALGHSPSEEVIAAILDLDPTDPDAQVALDALEAFMQSNGLTMSIKSDGGDTTASLTIDENTTGVTTVDAFDPQDDPVTYTISGGADAALFQIDEVTGELSFIDAPDYEIPGSADADNFYDVTVMAFDADSGQTDSQAITVEVQDVVETTTGTTIDFDSGTISGEFGWDWGAGTFYTGGTYTQDDYKVAYNSADWANYSTDFGSPIHDADGDGDNELGSNIIELPNYYAAETGANITNTTGSNFSLVSFDIDFDEDGNSGQFQFVSNVYNADEHTRDYSQAYTFDAVNWYWVEYEYDYNTSSYTSYESGYTSDEAEVAAAFDDVSRLDIYTNGDYSIDDIVVDDVAVA